MGILERYTVSDLVGMTKIPAHEISKLVFGGLIEPEVYQSSGSGDPSLFGPRNAKELVLVKELQRLGVKRAMIRDVVKTLTQSTVDWWQSGGWLVGVGDKWWLTDNLFAESNQVVIAKASVCFIIRVGV